MRAQEQQNKTSDSKTNPIIAIVISLIFILGCSCTGVVLFTQDLPWLGVFSFFMAGMMLIALITGIVKEKSGQRARITQQEILALTRNLYSLSPEEFERYIGILFEKQGFKVSHVGKSGDKGVDLRLILTNGSQAIAQCKRYNLDNKIGPALIREFRGVMAREHVIYGYIITTTKFTDGAIKEASEMPDVVIKLLDGDQLSAWAKRWGLPGVVMFQ